MAPSLALGLAVACSLCWAGLDATRKQLAGVMPATALVVWLSFGQVPAYALWWYFAGGTIKSVDYVVPAVIGLALNVAANLCFVRAVHISDLSTTIPMLAFTPVFTAAIANPLLGERPGWLALSGIVAVVVGALLLTSTPPAAAVECEGDTPGPVRTGWRARFNDPGALLMLVTAACWSTTTVLDKMATRSAPISLHALVINAGVGTSLLIYLLVRRRAAELAGVRERPGVMLGAIVAGTGAFGLQLWAIQGMLVGAVETIKRAIGMLSSIVVGRLAFQETISVRKVLAAVIMAAGTAVIMLDKGG